VVSVRIFGTSSRYITWALPVAIAATAAALILIAAG
jgi:hypothetical protein